MRPMLNEAYVKPLKPGEALLTIKESDDESEEEESEIKELHVSDIEEE